MQQAQYGIALHAIIRVAQNGAILLVLRLATKKLRIISKHTPTLEENLLLVITEIT